MKQAFINSLPKSGTHLTAKCLKLMGYSERDHVGSAQVLNPGLASKLRRLSWLPVRQGYLVGIDTPVEISRRAVHRMLRRAPAHSFFTAHVGYATALLDAVVAHDVRPIVVFRDPRAVLVSFVHYVAERKEHVIHEEFASLTMEERFDAVLNGRRFRNAYLESLRTRCLALEGWLNSDDTVKIRFEDLVGNRGGGSDEIQRNTLQRLCDSLDIVNPPIDKVVEELFGPGRHTFRKGQVASWQEEIPESLMPAVTAKVGDIIERWGYHELYKELDTVSSS
ncbi:MAG: sulfotransferase domain-containing protein [Rhodothermales bacterium]|nr:sulfotransferase domain-containing protein [Rhodothermales bacterium]